MTNDVLRWRLLLGATLLGMTGWMAVSQSFAQPAPQASERPIAAWTRVQVPAGAQQIGRFNGRQYRLSTSIYHAFGPTPPGMKESSAIIAKVQLVALDGQPVDADLMPVRAWFVAGEQQVWETGFTDEPRPEYPDRIERVARGGPHKGPGSPRRVDVVVLIRAGAAHMLLIAKDQGIAG